MVASVENALDGIGLSESLERWTEVKTRRCVRWEVAVWDWLEL